MPLVDLHNITIKDLNATGGLLPAGIVRCNESNPCTDINFQDVNMTAWWDDMEWSFITEYVSGSIVNTTP